jgi:thiol-disulfide isomerase/thioredoxin
MRFLATVVASMFVTVFRLEAEPSVSGPSANPEVARVVDPGFIELSESELPQRDPSLGPAENLLARDKAAQAWVERARKYCVRHSSGPNRAELILLMYRRRPDYVATIGPGYDKGQWDDITHDTARRLEFLGDLTSLLESVKQDPLASEPQRTSAERALVELKLGSPYDTKSATEYEAIQADIFAIAARNADVSRLQRILLLSYAGLGAVEYERFLLRLIEHPNESIQTTAGRARDALGLQKKMASDMRFRALDGREVDLGMMRGKVVVVDFWATWCAPCLAELPNLARMYEKYHEKGLEIIGITLENARMRDAESDEVRRRNLPIDTTEQTAEKFRAGRDKLLRFVADKKIPWPQYYDGRHWSNKWATDYSIQSIPAVFLIDSHGNLVSTSARGVTLERQIRRLLNLELN